MLPSSKKASQFCQQILANFPEPSNKSPYGKVNLIIADENISSIFVEALNYLAYQHKVASVNYPHIGLDLYKGMSDSELIQVAERNNCAPIITKDDDLKIYEGAILLPVNGIKEKKDYLINGLRIVLEYLSRNGFSDYEIYLPSPPGTNQIDLS